MLDSCGQSGNETNLSQITPCQAIVLPETQKKKSPFIIQFLLNLVNGNQVKYFIEYSYELQQALCKILFIRPMGL